MFNPVCLAGFPYGRKTSILAISAILDMVSEPEVLTESVFLEIMEKFKNLRSHDNPLIMPEWYLKEKLEEYKKENNYARRKRI